MKDEEVAREKNQFVQLFVIINKFRKSFISRVFNSSIKSEDN